MKPWSELTITDDFIFCKVMQNESLCKKMLEILLNISINRIEYIQNQYSISPDYNKHSVRLDVYVKDSNRVFDIEIQTTDNHNLEKRARYYQSLMDIDQLDHSVDYSELKESYVIFICTFDPFRYNKLIYSVQQTFVQSPDKIYDDNTRKLFYNLTASELGREDSELGNFLRYLLTNEPTDSYTQQISKEVNDVKHSVRWRKEYMTVGEWVKEEVKKEVAIEVKKELSKRVGEEVAKEVNETVLEIARKLLAQNIPVETVVAATHLTKEQVAALM